MTYQHHNLRKQNDLENKSKTLEAAIAYNKANKARLKVLLSQTSNNQETFDQLKAYDLFLDSQLITFSRQLEEIKKELLARQSNQPWNPQKKKITFEDIYGMEREKEELSDLITYLKVDQPSLVNFDRIKPRGYLLYGPPGTGKSFLMKALCEETGTYYLEVDPSRFDKTYVGEVNEELEKIWKEAEEHEKCIIFMDEISGLANRENRGDSKVAANIVNNLLLKLDGFKSNEKKIILMAATNHLNQVDAALKNRFSKIIKIDVIKDEEIEGFFKHQLRNYQISYHTFTYLKEMANRCKGKGYSNRELTQFLDNAYQKTFKYQQQNPLHNVMLPSDLEEVLDFKQGISKTSSQIQEHRLASEKTYQDWTKGLKTHLPKKKDMTEVTKHYYFTTLSWPGHDEPSDILSFVRKPFIQWETDEGSPAFGWSTFDEEVGSNTEISGCLKDMQCEKAHGQFTFSYKGPQYLLEEDKDYYIGKARLPYDPNNQIGTGSTKEYHLHFNPVRHTLSVYTKKMNTKVN
ncbi:AAA family ATPase [Candidatus Phytoplasma oryzae]|nr:AAA family ATPase [Candidatus Phytoplasma oryzae]